MTAAAGAGTAGKKFAAKAGLLGSSMVALNRASRRPPAIAYTIAAIQPPLFSSCNCQKYRIRPGATPKLTKSARLSSSAPNFDCPLIMRATRPSRPSSTAANTIAPTANSIRPSVESRIAVSPAQIASKVMKLGTSIRTGIGRNRRRRNSGDLGSKAIMPIHIASAGPLRHWGGEAAIRARRWLIGAVGPAGVAELEIGQDGLARDRGLAFGDQRFGAFRQVYVEARAEADQSEPLAGADRLAFADEADDPPRHQACDLDHADTALRRGDHQRITLVVLARLVELGIDEGARPIGDAVDPPRHRTAVHMAVEHAHEDRDARQRPVAETEFGRRQYLRHHRDAPVGRRHHDALAHRRHPHRIAEEQRAPDGKPRADPAQRRR